MSATSGRRVVSDGRLAPECLVMFKCPKCFGELTLDAFNGPATCPACQPNRVFMEPQHVVRDRPPLQRYQPPSRARAREGE